MAKILFMVLLRVFIFNALLSLTISQSAFAGEFIANLATRFVPIDKMMESVREGIEGIFTHKEMCRISCQEANVGGSCTRTTPPQSIAAIKDSVSQNKLTPAALVNWMMQPTRTPAEKRTSRYGRVCKDFCQDKVRFILPQDWEVVMKVRFKESAESRGIVKKALGLGKKWDLKKCVEAYYRDPSALYLKILKNYEEKKGKVISIDVYNSYQLNSVLDLIKEVGELDALVMHGGKASPALNTATETIIKEKVVEVTDIEERDSNGNISRTEKHTRKQITTLNPLEESRKFISIIEKLESLKKLFEAPLLVSPSYVYESEDMKEAWKELEKVESLLPIIKEAMSEENAEPSDLETMEKQNQDYLNKHEQDRTDKEPGLTLQEEGSEKSLLNKESTSGDM